jgi:hypothetical protein
MNIKLSKDDSCAVDLLLEQPVTPNQGMSPCFTQAPSSEVLERLKRVEALFHVLGGYKAAEPDEGLTERTVARCERAMPSNNLPPLDPLATAS